MITTEQLKSQAIKYNLEELEHKLSAVTRGYASFSDQDWLDLENTMLRLALEIATLDSSNLPVPDGHSDLVLNILGRALGNCVRDASYPTGFLATLGAISFAAAGNFSTAAVFADHALKNDHTPTNFERWILSVLKDTRQLLDHTSVPEWFEEYRGLIRYALLTGEPKYFEDADQAMRSIQETAPSIVSHSDILVLLIWAHVHERFYELSAARILLESGTIPRNYVSILLKTSSPLLYPTQAMAIENNSLLNTNGNSLVLLPTSTGKSLLGELTLIASITETKPLGVYLAPYRALTDQIFKRMRSRLAKIGIRCEARRGGYLTGESIDFDSKTVLVATPEAFDALLRQRPELYRRVACCVFDEFHLLEQPVRGIRYEGLVGRLTIADLSTPCRIVALSPVLDPTNELQTWLNVDENNIIRSDWKPTGRRVAIAGPDKKAYYYTPEDHLEPSPSKTKVAWEGKIPFPFPRVKSPNLPYTHLYETYDQQVSSNIVEVAIDQYNRLKQPILILCTSRKQTRAIASLVSERLPLVDESNPLKPLVEILTRRYPFLYSLRKCLAHGVAYHNASLPNWVRERLERNMEVRNLKIVVATTTLAEGVDLPFRAVVLADWQQWSFGKQSPLPSLLFRNIAGRCGRAGAFAEGDTIIVDNPGRKPSGIRYSDRHSQYLRLYVKPKSIELTSSISRTVDASSKTGIAEMNAALESQFTAFIDAVRPEAEEGTLFSESLFAGKFKQSAQHVSKIATDFVQDMLDEPEFSVMQRNSPLSLTTFGRKVIATGLSPRSAISLARFLRAYEPAAAPAKSKAERERYNIEWNPIIVSLCERLLEEDDFVAELKSGEFIRVHKKGNPVTPKNLHNVVMAWVSGVPIEEITHLTLRKKDLRVAYSEWLSDPLIEPPSKMEAWIELVSVFLNGYVAQQWAWVLRGSSEIVSGIDERLARDLAELAKRIEYGVKYTETVELLRHGCAVDRSKLDKIVEAFLDDHPYASANSSFFNDWVNTHREKLLRIQAGADLNIQVNDLDLQAISNYFQSRSDD